MKLLDCRWTHFRFAIFSYAAGSAPVAHQKSRWFMQSRSADLTACTGLYAKVNDTGKGAVYHAALTA